RRWRGFAPPAAVSRRTTSSGSCRNWSVRHERTYSVPRVPLRVFHPLPEAERAHVGPHFLDISKALVFGAGLSGGVPAEGVLAVCRPDRVLLFVVHDNLVDRRVFAVFRTHDRPPTWASRHVAARTAAARQHPTDVRKISALNRFFVASSVCRAV